MSEAHIVFDRNMLRRRQARARRAGAALFLLEHVAAELSDRLSAVLRDFALAADIGTPDDALARTLRESRSVSRLIAARRCTPSDIVADEECLPFADGSLDLAVSGLALHHVNDLPGTLVQIRRALRPDGLFMAAMLGGETLTELRQSLAAAEIENEGGVSPRVAPFADLRDLGALLHRAGFALPVSDVDRLVVRYADAFGLMRDLRLMGATNILTERRRTPLRRTTLLRAAQFYAQRFSDPDGRVRATFDIVWLSGWSPHPDQQKPLRPGAARARLADALGTSEIPAGERAGRQGSGVSGRRR